MQAGTGGTTFATGGIVGSSGGFDASGFGGAGGTASGGAGGAAGTNVISATGGAGTAGSGGNAIVGSGGAAGRAASNTDAGASDGEIVPRDAGGTDGAAGPVAGTASIFDGLTLNGWVQSSKMWWSVKEGAINGRSTTGGELIMTVDDYADFRVVFSSRMPFNASGGHLGIGFWGGRAPVGSYNKCKLYIPPNPWTWDYSTNTGLANVTYTTTSTMDATVWHQTELLCRLATGTCLAAVDGKLIMTYKEKTLTSIKEGPIGLQIHAGNSEVQYKDIFIDPAPKDDKLLTLR